MAVNPYKPRQTVLRAPTQASPVAPPPPPSAVSVPAGPARSLTPNSVVLGRYVIQKVIGRGGMAAVYLAKNQETERLVALKILDPEISSDPSYVERFRREARAAGRIRSDNVVAIYDLGTDANGTLVLVMEYLEGQNVQQVLRNGRLPLARAMNLARQLCEGLAAAHEAGVIHRDLKPANLFVERNAAGHDKLKILDFGISKLSEPSSQELTRAGQTLGTLAYMSPEQIRGQVKGNDPRIDLYSAGVSIFLMLTAKRPIDADDTVQLLQAVLEKPPLSLSQAAGTEFPPAVEAFIAKALVKDSSQRYQSAMEMREALIQASYAAGVDAHGGQIVSSTNTAPPMDIGSSTVVMEPVSLPADFVPPGRRTPPSGVVVSGPEAMQPAGVVLPAFEDDEEEGKTQVRAPMSMTDSGPVLTPLAGRRGAAPEQSPSPSPAVRQPTLPPQGAPRHATIMGVGGSPSNPGPMGPLGPLGPLGAAAPPPPAFPSNQGGPGDRPIEPTMIAMAGVTPGFPAHAAAPPQNAFGHDAFPPAPAASPTAPTAAPPRRRTSPVLLGAAGIAVVGIAAALGVLVLRRPAPAPTPAPVVQAAVSPQVAPTPTPAPAPIAQPLTPPPAAVADAGSVALVAADASAAVVAAPEPVPAAPEPVPAAPEPAAPVVAAATPPPAPVVEPAPAPATPPRAHSPSRHHTAETPAAAPQRVETVPTATPRPARAPRPRRGRPGIVTDTPF